MAVAESCLSGSRPQETGRGFPASPLEIERETGDAPAETLLVLDGTTGQNAISQAKLFNEATKLTGVVVTKLDSTAKGGVLVAIVDTLEIPIKFIGLGESADALRPFKPAEFINALFEE